MPTMKPNEASIEACFRAHQSHLLGFCVRMIGQRQVAEELVQDVFLAACAAEAPGVSKAWLYRCARNRCIDHLRRRGVWQRVKSLLRREERAVGVEEQILERSLGVRVLQALPEKMRTALVLRSYAGLDYRELAEVLEIQESSVKVLLSRARKKACRLLDEEQRDE